MLFGLWIREGPNNHVLGRGPDPLRGRDDFAGISRPIVKYKEYQASAELCGMWIVVEAMRLFAISHAATCF